jgi:hypothetical protein
MPLVLESIAYRPSGFYRRGREGNEAALRDGGEIARNERRLIWRGDGIASFLMRTARGLRR